MKNPFRSVFEKSAKYIYVEWIAIVVKGLCGCSEIRPSGVLRDCSSESLHFKRGKQFPTCHKDKLQLRLAVVVVFFGEDCTFYLLPSNTLVLKIHTCIVECLLNRNDLAI